MRIPFSTLRFQRTEGPQVWGFDAVRFYPRTTSAQMGAFPRDRNNNCYLCQAIEIEGFAGVSPGRNLEIVPTMVATRPTRSPEPPRRSSPKATSRASWVSRHAGASPPT
jgi:hypothetical protein